MLHCTPFRGLPITSHDRIKACRKKRLDAGTLASHQQSSYSFSSLDAYASRDRSLLRYAAELICTACSGLASCFDWHMQSATLPHAKAHRGWQTYTMCAFCTVSGIHRCQMQTLQAFLLHQQRHLALERTTEQVSQICGRSASCMFTIRAPLCSPIQHSAFCSLMLRAVPCSPMLKDPRFSKRR